MDLVTPSSQYKDSFIQAVKEYHAVDADNITEIYELNIEELENDFPSYISNLLSESEGQHLPAGYVPQTTYWLIDQGEFIGTISIRHRLTDRLLQEGGHIGYDIRPSKRKMGYGKKYWH